MTKCKLTPDSGAIAVTCPYHPDFVYELKRYIPATDRRFRPTDKAWLVAPKWGTTLQDICMRVFNELPLLPTLANNKPVIKQQINMDDSAIVDDDVYEKESKHNWYITPEGYAARMSKRPNGERVVLYLHWCVLRAPKGFVVDHINGNRLDNRRENLRICTKAQNNANIHKDKFKGVCWRDHAKAYKAYIKKNGKQIHLGYFKNKIEAARAYNNAAVNLFGEFASLNQLEAS